MKTHDTRKRELEKPQPKPQAPAPKKDAGAKKEHACCAPRFDLRVTATRRERDHSGEH